MIHKNGIIENLNTEFIGKEIFVFDAVQSTNDTAKEYAEKAVLSGSVIISETQTKGKGREGRAWFSEKNSGIYISIILRPEFEMEKICLITIISALAVEEAIYEACDIKTDIKWPNDILFTGKKICGILSEMNSVRSQVNYVVVGIGINVNNEYFDSEIKDIAISIRQAALKAFKREAVLIAVLEKFEKYYNMLKENSVNEIINMYKKKCISIGSCLKVMYNGRAEYVKGIDIDTKGNLIVEKDNKEKFNICSQEASILGLNGYLGFKNGGE